MKLELKYLAGYLPYELKGVFKLIEVVAHSVKEVNNNRVKGLNIDNVDFFLDYCKPILRPLSDLKKEIEVDGEKFVPDTWIYNNIRRNVDIYKPMTNNYPLEINIDTEDYSQCIDLYDGFLIMQKLLEWHFDIYGLIENGLAIDINTLNKNNE